MIAAIRMSQASQALAKYPTGKELSLFLKGYFKQFPKMGSRDRREVSQLVYGALRVKTLFAEASIEQRIWLGSLLCEAEPGAFAMHWTPHFAREAWPGIADFAEKLDWLAERGFVAHWEGFFPQPEAISSAIELQSFYAAHLATPFTWIRVRQKYLQATIKELEQKGIAYEQNAGLPTALALKAGVKLDALQCWAQGWIEVQDLASQMTGSLFEPKASERWLDACAGAGGKSLMLLDLQPELSLFVTDVREEILQRLHERFKRAGIRSYSRAVLDLTRPGVLQEAGSFPKQFDAIIADVPCSGSGTWASSPEMLESQRQLDINSFTERQYQIAANLLPSVKTGGRLIYLTCSVYAAENEEVVSRLLEHDSLELQQQQYFQLSAEGGDVLFGAVLLKR